MKKYKELQKYIAKYGNIYKNIEIYRTISKHKAI